MNFDSKQLPDKDIRRARSNETRGIIKVGSSIEERPIEINTRSEFGHWEVDTVLSSRGESKHCLVTFIERKTRLLWAIKMNSRCSEALNEAFKKFHNNFGSTVKSITVDHVKEFSKYREIENDYGINVFFCHPYSPWNEE
ncbi:hypothetical protein IV88_GL001290 [Pediococcus argentinicus]|uniref:Integrase catalytic domain-containing protein n=1 Tax=Pediococcus argentinicus TaxID=480391 RepID=A0A0R2N8I6_9LACO|nr:hypothetical protein IV88_GL001290 [Pediococcus argentinicus]GEP20199.1 hypothetical protein LSA03_15830 [Pediococcus argentinicus]